MVVQASPFGYDVEMTENIAIRHVAPILVARDGDMDDWLAQRRQGITATDIAPLLGVSKWKTAAQVWADKTGHTGYAAPEPGPAAQLGNDLEEYLVAKAPDIWGIPPAEPTPGWLYAHPEQSLHLASPDAHTTYGPPALVEVKTAGLFNPGSSLQWSEPEAPWWAQWQVQWQMHVTGYNHAYLCVLVGNVGPRHWRIDYDPDLCHALARKVTAWWATHVNTHTEPPLVAGDLPALKSLYPTAAPETVRHLEGPDAVAAMLAARIEKAASQRIKRATVIKNTARATLARLTGGNEALEVSTENGDPAMVVRRTTNKKGVTSMYVYTPEA